jgi:hypothetical protein
VLAARGRGVYVVCVTSNCQDHEFRAAGFTATSQSNPNRLLLEDVNHPAQSRAIRPGPGCSYLDGLGAILDLVHPGVHDVHVAAIAEDPVALSCSDLVHQPQPLQVG